MCAKHYQAVRNFFSPGVLTICCACAKPKLIGFVVLEKREGPYALLNAIITRFAALPHFIVYDFGCEALRSALGKLPEFVALVVIISDLFHTVNHVCSDIFNPRSYTPLDGNNTAAHEQRNSPIAAMMKTLRASAQEEYMCIMKLHTILHNVHAQARTTCTFPLPDHYNFRQFYFSRQPCPCGCGKREEEPPLASPPSSAPSTPNASSLRGGWVPAAALAEARLSGKPCGGGGKAGEEFRGQDVVTLALLVVTNKELALSVHECQCVGSM